MVEALAIRRHSSIPGGGGEFAYCTPHYGPDEACPLCWRAATISFALNHPLHHQTSYGVLVTWVVSKEVEDSQLHIRT